jgi:hypothetical protein
MARTFTCICCRRILPANPRCKDQEYCGAAACQRERKRKWQARKMNADPEYRKNQQDAYKSWCERNPDYWRKRRQDKRREKAAAFAQKEHIRSNGPVKMDTLGEQDFHINSGEYLLVPMDVKMDALRVKIIAITTT